MIDKNQILSQLSSIIPLDLIILVVWYGNKGGRDVDLLVIVKGNHPYETGVINGLDIGCIGEDWVPIMLKGFDPMIIEPLLTGTTIYGEFDEKWGDIKSIEANEDTPDYLLHTAEIFYEWATKLAYQGNLRETLITLSFVQSYALYGFTYISNSNVVSLETIFKKQGGDIIKRIRHDAKSNQIIPNHQVNLAFNEVRKTLAELRMVLGYKSNP